MSATRTREHRAALPAPARLMSGVPMVVTSGSPPPSVSIRTLTGGNHAEMAAAAYDGGIRAKVELRRELPEGDNRHQPASGVDVRAGHEPRQLPPRRPGRRIVRCRDYSGSHGGLR